MYKALVDGAMAGLRERECSDEHAGMTWRQRHDLDDKGMWTVAVDELETAVRRSSVTYVWLGTLQERDSGRLAVYIEPFSACGSRVYLLKGDQIVSRLVDSNRCAVES